MCGPNSMLIPSIYPYRDRAAVRRDYGMRPAYLLPQGLSRFLFRKVFPSAGELIKPNLVLVASTPLSLDPFFLRGRFQPLPSLVFRRHAVARLVDLASRFPSSHFPFPPSPQHGWSFGDATRPCLRGAVPVACQHRQTFEPAAARISASPVAASHCPFSRVPNPSLGRRARGKSDCGFLGCHWHLQQPGDNRRRQPTSSRIYAPWRARHRGQFCEFASAPTYPGLLVEKKKRKEGKKNFPAWHGADAKRSWQGAAAVLDFYAIESPLAQPRNAVLGQLISAIIGVAIGKLFQLSPHYDSVRWLGASLACSLSTVVMGLTGTAHPPAGATALMAVLDEDVTKLGWFLIPPILLGSCLMLSVALLVNNVQRRFPYYWWSPEEMGMRWKKEHVVHVKNAETDLSPGTEDSASIDRDMEGEGAGPGPGDAEPEEEQPTVEFVTGDDTLVIAKNHVRIPRSMYLTFEEKLVLETLSQRL